MMATWWTMSADHGTAGKVVTGNMAATHVPGDALTRQCHNLEHDFCVVYSRDVTGDEEAWLRAAVHHAVLVTSFDSWESAVRQ